MRRVILLLPLFTDLNNHNFTRIGEAKMHWLGLFSAIFSGSEKCTLIEEPLLLFSIKKVEVNIVLNSSYKDNSPGLRI